MADLSIEFCRHQGTEPILAGVRAADRQGLQRHPRI